MLLLILLSSARSAIPCVDEVRYVSDEALVKRMAREPRMPLLIRGFPLSRDGTHRSGSVLDPWALQSLGVLDGAVDESPTQLFHHWSSTKLLAAVKGLDYGHGGGSATTWR